MARPPRFGSAENRRAHDEIRTSREVQAMLAEHGRRLQASLGPGYSAAVTPVTGRTYRKRSRLGVWTASIAAVRDNARNGSLTRALGRGIR